MVNYCIVSAKAVIIRFILILVLFCLVWQKKGEADCLRPMAEMERVKNDEDVGRDMDTIDFSLINFQLGIVYNSADFSYIKTNTHKDAVVFASLINRHFPYIDFLSLQRLLFHVLDNAADHSINKQGIIYVTIAGQIVEDELRLRVSNSCDMPLPGGLQDKVFYPRDKIRVPDKERHREFLRPGGLGLPAVSGQLPRLYSDSPIPDKKPNVRWRDEKISDHWNITFELRLPIDLNRHTGNFSVSLEFLDHARRYTNIKNIVHMPTAASSSI